MPRPGIIQNILQFSGFEPGTFRSSVWRSPNWAISACNGGSKSIYTDAHYSISTFNKFNYNEISSIIDDNLPVIISIWSKIPFLFAYRPIALMLSIKVEGFIDKSYWVTRNRRMFWGIKL